MLLLATEHNFANTFPHLICVHTYEKRQTNKNKIALNRKWFGNNSSKQMNSNNTINE